jgi:hypothetical protein
VAKQDGTQGISPLVGLVVVIRVIGVLAVWLLLFLGVFLGYFTVPILLVAALTVLYSVTDIGLFITVRRRERARREREDFLRARRKADRPDIIDGAGDA